METLVFVVATIFVAFYVVLRVWSSNQKNELKQRCIAHLREKAEELEAETRAHGESYGDIEYFENSKVTVAIASEALLIQLHDDPEGWTYILMEKIDRLDIYKPSFPYVMNINAAAVLTNTISHAQAGWNLGIHYENDAGYLEELPLNFPLHDVAQNVKNAIDARLAFNVQKSNLVN
jgi:hypothetical protein